MSSNKEKDVLFQLVVRIEEHGTCCDEYVKTGEDGIGFSVLGHLLHMLGMSTEDLLALSSSPQQLFRNPKSTVENRALTLLLSSGIPPLVLLELGEMNTKNGKETVLARLKVQLRRRHSLDVAIAEMLDPYPDLQSPINISQVVEAMQEIEFVLFTLKCGDNLQTGEIEQAHKAAKRIMREYLEPLGAFNS